MFYLCLNLSGFNCNYNNLCIKQLQLLYITIICTKLKYLNAQVCSGIKINTIEHVKKRLLHKYTSLLFNENMFEVCIHIYNHELSNRTFTK